MIDRFVHKGLVVAGLVPLAAALACSQGSPSFQQEATTNKARKHVVVQFSDASIHPSVARVLRGGDAAWINYSSNYTGSVLFPASIRDSFTCSELRPNFMKVAGGYQSIPITGGMAEVPLPCPLKPGEYTYTLQLFSGTVAAPAAGMGDPQLEMKGKLIVE